MIPVGYRFLLTVGNKSARASLKLRLIRADFS